MDQSKGYIEKKDTGSGFHQDVLAEGIEILQKLSGEVWTDYNHHDPGITLLESIVYAMSEMDYKAGNHMADLLIKEPDYKLKSGDNAMFVCSDIMTTNPVTIDDLRKLIVDRVKSVKNVWINTLTTTYSFKGSEFNVSDFSGIYAISVEMEYVSRSIFESEKSQVYKDIRSTFYEHRNICEYLYDINIFEPYELTFKIDITIEEMVHGEHMLAQAINAMNAYLSQEVQFKSLWELQNDLPTAEIFNGPKLHNGFVVDSSLQDQMTRVHVLDLINLIGGLEGIIRVNSIEIFHQPGGPDSEWVELDAEYIDIPKDHFPSLKIPERNQDVIFRTSGLRYHADINEVINELAYVDSVKYGNLRSGSKQSNEIPIPEGKYLGISSHYPVRFHLPDHYGVGHHGLISGLETIRYAQANQLKSYLLPIDQLMANMLGLMANTNQLYDVSINNYDSYFSQVLEDIEESLHLIDVPDKKKKRDQIHDWEGKLEELDNFFDINSTDRLQRVTDDLLARFSESYPSYSLSKSYAQLYPFLTREEIAKRILKAKREYIDNYDNISYERSKSCNYFDLAENLRNEEESESSEELLPGVIRKIANLLDISDFGIRSLCDVVEDSGIQFYEASKEVSEIIDQLNEERDEEDGMEISDYPDLSDQDTSIDEGFIFHSSPEDLLKDVLKYGLHQNNYQIKLLEKEKEKIAQVWLKNEQFSFLIHANKNPEKAEEFLTDCIQTLRYVDKSSEGLFFVEHVMLLPKLYEKNFGFSIDLRTLSPDIEITLEHAEKHSIGDRLKILERIVFGLINKSMALNVNSKDGKFFMEIIEEGEVLAVSKEQCDESDLEAFCQQIYRIYPCIDSLSVSGLKAFINDFHKWVYYGDEKVDEVFFSSRMTFALPAWPVRFQDDNFREFVKGTIYEVLPIHLVAYVRWLDFQKLEKFEDLYFSWIRSFSKEEEAERDNRALELVKFMIIIQNQAGDGGK